jgi:outer membrane protein TolC
VEEAYARLNQAEILWLPSIQFGLNYHRHEGNLQNIEGRIVDINRSSLNAGLGAGATAAGTTTVPGLSAQFHLADALFQPKIAERTAWARGHAAQAVVQDRLLDAALAYLELLEAAQAIAIAEEELARTEQLGRLTSEYARTGQGLPSDADRVQTEVALRRNGVLRAEERFAVASARLAEVLSLDGQYQLLPTETTVVPIDLVPLESRRQDLVASGLTQRPELQEARCLVAEACERLKREQYAPLVPSVLLGLSYGGFGGGVGGNVARFHDRADFDALAYWEIRNLGFGERAARRTVESQIEQARFQQVRLMDRVAREIAEAHAQAQYRQRQIAIAQSAVASAQDSYERNMSRIREGQGLPIEVLQSIQALAAARRDYLSSVMDYNTAQFRLQRALGWPVGSSAATVE